MRKKAKPDLWRAGLCVGGKKNCGGSLCHSPHRSVNAILFRLRPLTGLLTCGVWCDRLILWCPLIDTAARLLRDAIGGRI